MHILRLMPRKGVSRAAYRDKLTCPVCFSRAIRYVENLGPYRIRYRCRKCGLPFQYDISGKLNHPYAAFNKPKYKGIVAGSKRKGVEK